MFGPRYFGPRYFGARYWGGEVGVQAQEGDYYGDRYFGPRYFGNRYWGGNAPQLPALDFIVREVRVSRVSVEGVTVVIASVGVVTADRVRTKESKIKRVSTIITEF